MDPLVILFGLGVGILVGMTGMGGGSLMTPLLILVFGTKPVVAVGTDLAYAAVTKTRRRLAALPQGHRVPAAWRSGWRSARARARSAASGCSTGCATPTATASTTFMLVAIGGALLLTGGARAPARAVDARTTRRASAARSGWRRATRSRRSRSACSVGFVLGITSAGSGTLIAVGLIIVFRLTPHRVVGTDVVHAAVLLWVAAIAHMVSGNVDFGLAGTILLGSIPGVWIGTPCLDAAPADAPAPRARHRADRRRASALISKAGAAIPLAALVGIPVAWSRSAPPCSARARSSAQEPRWSVA